MNSLSNHQQKIQSKYDFMLNKKKELTAELQKKEKLLTSLKNNQEGIKTLSASDLNLSDETEDEKISRFLISAGKITMEQNETAMKKMAVLKMDYLATCMALGFIDLETSKKVMKANKASTRRLKQ